MSRDLFAVKNGDKKAKKNIFKLLAIVVREKWELSGKAALMIVLTVHRS